MSTIQNPIGQLLLKSILRLLIGENKLQFYKTIDWRHLRECFRLLKPGGQLIILDGNQKRLRHAKLLIKIFKETLSTLYATESVDDWMKAAGLEAVSL